MWNKINIFAVKNFKVMISLMVFSFIFSFNYVLADSCDELKPILDRYYKASQEENIEAYMTVMDQDYLRENLIDNYEDYVKSAWEVYDTKEYKLDIYNCKMEETDAMAYLNLATTLLSEGQEVETQRNYVALFHKLDTWKIKYVMDENDFSQFQTSLHSQLLLDATKENLIKNMEDMEAVIEFAKIEEELLASDFDDTVADGVAPREQVDRDENSDDGNGFWYFILLVALFVGGYVYFKKYRNNKNLCE